MRPYVPRGTKKLGYDRIVILKIMDKTKGGDVQLNKNKPSGSK